jgi:hypothetical protein
MNTHRIQKNGRVVNMPVYISEHITDEMIELFLKSENHYQLILVLCQSK